MAQVPGLQRTDPFARVLGPGRGRVPSHDDVLLVEDHGCAGARTVAVFATRSAEVARDIAGIHSHAAAMRWGGEQTNISVTATGRS